MIVLKKWLPFLMILCSFAGTSCRQPSTNVYDGFERKSLSNIWSTDRMERHSFQIQSNVVREGKNAAKITLRTGDVVEAGNDSSLDSERDELREAEYLESTEGIEYEYEFSLFLPSDFPIVPTRLILAQWKQHCHRKSCSDDSPVLAVRYQSGKLFITLNNDSGRHYLCRLNEDIKNKWLDFKFQITFSTHDDGKIIAFLNGENIIIYKGTTSYSGKRGYFQKGNNYYFKMGLYRDRMPEPMSIYIDEYRKKIMK